MTLQESGNARLRELNSADDLADLVHAVGFIPLFSNAVKGFSCRKRLFGGRTHKRQRVVDWRS